MAVQRETWILWKKHKFTFGLTNLGVDFLGFLVPTCTNRRGQLRLRPAKPWACRALGTGRAVAPAGEARSVGGPRQAVLAKEVSGHNLTPGLFSPCFQQFSATKGSKGHFWTVSLRNKLRIAKVNIQCRDGGKQLCYALGENHLLVSATCA